MPEMILKVAKGRKTSTQQLWTVCGHVACTQSVTVSLVVIRVSFIALIFVNRRDELGFYGDLVYKFKTIVHRADFSDQFRKIIVRYKRIGYNKYNATVCMLHMPWRELTLKTLKALNTLE